MRIFIALQKDVNYHVNFKIEYEQDYRELLYWIDLHQPVIELIIKTIN
jgi:hypothetical protein